MTLEHILESMETIYDRRQTRTMAKERLNLLKLATEGTRVDEVADYERQFRRLPAGAGHLDDEVMLLNLHTALRQEERTQNVSTGIYSGDIVSFSKAFAALRAAATTMDAREPRKSSTVASTYYQDSDAWDRQGATTPAPPFYNRRLSNAFKK